MAHIIGTSQAWQSVLTALAPDSIPTPAALRLHYAQLLAQRPNHESLARAHFHQRRLALSHAVQSLASRINAAHATASAQLAPAIRAQQHTLHQLRNAPTLLRRLFNHLFAIPAASHRLAALNSQLLQPVALRNQHIAHLQELLAFEKNPAAAIAQFVRDQEQHLERYTRVLASPEFAGATAELEVVERLASLPDAFTVIHDLRLDLGRWIRFQNQNLRTAQIDHLVVGPTGIFVIETKRWSTAFAAANTGLDPFEQVGRARFCCQCFLRDRGFTITVRDIIANAGAHLTKPPNAFTRICHPNVLSTHILSQKPNLTPIQVTQILSQLTSG